MLVPGKLFQPVFVNKARNLPWSGVPERCFIQAVSGLTRKHYTNLEWPSRDKHSSLLQKLINNRQMKFLTFAPDRKILRKTYCEYHHSKFSGATTLSVTTLDRATFSLTIQSITIKNDILGPNAIKLILAVIRVFS